MNHNLPPSKPEDTTRRHFALLGCFFAIVGTIISSINHLAGWTVGGLLLLGANIACFLYSPGEK